MITERPKSLQKCLCFHLDYAYTIYVFCLVLVPAKLILFVWFSYRGAVSLYQGNSNWGFQNKSGKSLYCHIHWWNNWQVREMIDSTFENWFYLVIDYNQCHVHHAPCISIQKYTSTWQARNITVFSSVLCSNMHVHMLWNFFFFSKFMFVGWDCWVLRLVSLCLFLFFCQGSLTVLNL